MAGEIANKIASILDQMWGEKREVESKMPDSPTLIGWEDHCILVRYKTYELGWTTITKYLGLGGS